VCGDCGGFYGRKVWHSTSKYRRMIWQCNHKFSNNEKCKTPHLDEDKIKAHFMVAVNKLITDKEEIISNFEAIKATLFNTKSLETEQSELQNEMEVVASMIQQCINENARIVQNQEEYQKRYDVLVQRFDDAKSKLAKVTVQIKDKVTRLANIETFIADLSKQGDLLTDFDPLLWHSLVDFINVYGKDEIQFTFKDGSEIKV
jgi:glutathionyl-hydroquinone reductase